MECARLTRYGLLVATGADARAFLHAQLTNDIEAIARIAYLPRRIAVGDLSTMRLTSHSTLASSSAAGTT